MYTILIIDDDPVFTRMMSLILQTEGFCVRTVSDGQSGLASIGEKRPDLILCDICMPDVDGYVVLEALKRERVLADIPFIFVTGMGERDDIRRGMSSGADDYLPKPFSADELLAAVAGRIKRHEMIIQQCLAPDCEEEQTILREKITKREREVLLMVGRGATSREIAKKMGVTLKTIEAHRANLMNKLDARNAATLARWSVIAEKMENESNRG